MSRAVYHSRRREQAATPVHGPAAVIALVLLFPDDSKSVALIRHSINVDEKVVTVVDPGEIPVFACDQSLFKIAQKNQWMWPKKYGEESFVIILSGLYIKMAVLKALGHLLDGSDLASALIQAEIATALIFIPESGACSKTALAHQITACGANSAKTIEKTRTHRLMAWWSV